MSTDIETLLSRLYHPELRVIEPGLERVERFLALLGSPQHSLPPVIHVAGTNGKGSLIAYLAAIFKAAGLKAHRYTSPHLVCFNERIILGGTPIADDDLKQLIENVTGYIDRQPVTFFEATTAAAYLAFAQQPADVLLLEVGMGGRLDATNVIDQPALTAITPVSLDHRNFLGDTVAAIAEEKAGIMKHRVPCVVGRQSAEAASIINRNAEGLSAPLYSLDHDWQVLWEGKRAMYQSPVRTLEINPSLAGLHQFDNAATAVACIDKFPQFNITDAQIREGLAHTVWPARLQHLTEGRFARMLPNGIELWLDGGHNQQGGEILAQWLQQRGVKNVYLICGMVKGKESRAYLEPLKPFVTSMVCVAISGEPLSQPAELLQMVAGDVGINAVAAPDVEKALQTILRHAKTPAIICISGSLYLAGKVLAVQQEA